MSRPRRQPQPHEGGRWVTTLTQAVHEQIVTGVLAGATLQGAAHYAGVSHATFNRWLYDGRRNPGTPEADLVAAIDQALGAFEVNAVAGIRRAAAANWSAWAWLLERRFPDRYSRMVKQDVSITESSDDPRIVALHKAGFEGDVSLLDEEDIETLISIMAKAIPGGQAPVLGADQPVIEQGGGETNGQAT